MGKKQEDYKENGVSFSKALICVGDEVTLSYKGILLEKGSADIFLHFGYGDEWEEKELLQMKNERGAYKVKVKIKHSGNLNFCFKDSVENWDNNATSNYLMSVEEKKAKKEKKESTSKTKTKVEKPAKETAKIETKAGTKSATTKSAGTKSATTKSATTKSATTKTSTPKTTAKPAVKATKKS